MESKDKKDIQINVLPLVLHNRQVLKILVNNCFPITYTDEFYLRVATLYKDYARFAAIKDVVVGAVLCRMEEDKETKETFLHLMILLVLEKYRKLGIAQKLMDFIYKQVSKVNKEVKSFRLHVQKTNTGAVEFYKKQGFTIVNEIAKYYDIEDGSAYEMRKSINN